jgi:hypothetical protein
VPHAARLNMAFLTTERQFANGKTRRASGDLALYC